MFLVDEVGAFSGFSIRLIHLRSVLVIGSMSSSESMSCSSCSFCSDGGSVSDGSKSGDPAMMIGEKVRFHEGDHWLGRGRLR
jgi:hypothetical protein